MTTLNVPDMHCEKCVERITNALRAAKLNFQVSLEEKTVTIDGTEDCVKTAVEALDDLGFDSERR
jgi:copper chaperone CopZ